MKNLFTKSDRTNSVNSIKISANQKQFVEGITGISLGNNCQVLAYEYARHLCPGDEPLKMSEFELCNAYARITTDIERDIMDVVCGGVSEIVVFLPLRTEMPEDCHSPNRETGYFPLVSSNITNVRAIVYDKIYSLLNNEIFIKAVIDATGMEHAKDLRGFYYIFANKKESEDVIFARMKGEMMSDSVEGIKNISFGADNGIIFSLAYDTVANFDFPLDPLYYIVSCFREDWKEDSLRLKDIVRLIHHTDFDMNVTGYTLDDFKSESSDVLWGKKVFTNNHHKPSEFVTFESSHPLLFIADDRRKSKYLYLSNEKKYSVIKEYTEFRASSLTQNYVPVGKHPVVCLEIQEDKVYPEYFVFNLMQEVNKTHISAFNALIYSLLGWGCGLIEHDIMNLLVYLPENLVEQKKFIDYDKEKFIDAKYKELEVERKRLNVSLAENTNDIAHLLQTPFIRQKFYMDSIKEELDKGQDADVNTLLQLFDTVSYIKRFIGTWANGIKSMSCQMKNIDVMTFISDYNARYKNFMGNRFNMYVTNKCESVSVNADKELLEVLFDQLYENAFRHGFHKKASPNNCVEVIMQNVDYRNGSYVLLQVINNGQPFADDFDLKSYITKGEFRGESGHTGYGGNHVYEVIKKHNGFLALHDGQPGFDILLPCDKLSNESKNKQYNGETI